jgi:hypothetical protein
MKKSVQDFLASSDVQTFLELSILKPLLDKVFQYLYPYLLGVMSLWIIMFLCTIMVLVILLSGIPQMRIQGIN